MLTCSYIGSNFPGGNWKHTKFFDLWSRSESEYVTEQIINLLGYSDSVVYKPESNRLDLYATYQRLPALDLATSDLSLIQCHALFSKNGDMMSPIDKKEVAYRSFVESEDSCRKVNESFASREIYRIENVGSIIHYAQAFIAGVLGRCPSLSDLEPAFGPGASVTDVSVKNTSPQWKLTGTVTLSNSLLPLREEVRAFFPGWLSNANMIPSTGKLEFVPKSHKTDRSIMIEPLLNAFLQKGVGKWIKRKLYSAGIDLTDQSIQRERARIGSIDGSFATIDLSRASDSVSYALVMDLLPWDWFVLLDSLRTPICRYRKETFVLEKFSSMGNGYTFELETLVFKALAFGIARTFNVEDNSVCYGDDITCSTELALLIEDYFPKLGFTVNREKSFLYGVFREACGGDFREGIDVRPFFLRSLRDGGRWNLAKVFSFHNFLQRKEWFDSTGEIRRYLLSIVPDEAKVFGPDGYGDGYLLSKADPATYLPRVSSSSRRRKWHEGYFARSFSAVNHECEGPDDITNLPSYVAYAGLSEDGPYERNVVRAPKGARIRSTLKRMVVLQP